MANRLSRNAPYQVASLSIHEINDVFRQIQQAVDELRGLNGAVTLYGTLTFDSSQFGSTTDLQDVAATESVGTSEKLVRADHQHAHGTGYLPNAHHDQVHAIDGADHTGNLDASAITYTPAVLADWNGSADPGDADDALDQLADRMTTVEAATGTSVDPDTNFVDGPDTDQIWEKVIAGNNITITEIGNGEAIKIDGAAAGGGSLTVEEVDGTPSVASVSTLRFDQGDGFTVTDDGGGQATVGFSGGGNYDATLVSNLNEFIEGDATDLLVDRLWVSGALQMASQGESNVALIRGLEPLTNGDETTPELIFAGGEVVMA